MLRDRAEEAGRDRQVVERPLGVAQRLAQLLEGRRVVVVAVDVVEAARPAWRRRPRRRRRASRGCRAPGPEIVRGPSRTWRRRRSARRGARAGSGTGWRERPSCRPGRRWRRRRPGRRTASSAVGMVIAPGVQDFLLEVAAEGEPHRREDLIGEVVVAARAEPGEQGRAEDGRGHALVDGAPRWSSGLRPNRRRGPRTRRARGSSSSAWAVRSSSHEAMTLPRRQTSAMSARFRSYW